MNRKINDECLVLNDELIPTHHSSFITHNSPQAHGDAVWLKEVKG